MSVPIPSPERRPSFIIHEEVKQAVLPTQHPFVLPFPRHRCLFLPGMHKRDVHKKFLARFSFWAVVEVGFFVPIGLLCTYIRRALTGCTGEIVTLGVYGLRRAGHRRKSSKTKSVNTKGTRCFSPRRRYRCFQYLFCFPKASSPPWLPLYK